jgi:hypothetical protein
MRFHTRSEFDRRLSISVLSWISLGCRRSGHCEPALAVAARLQEDARNRLSGTWAGAQLARKLPKLVEGLSRPKVRAGIFRELCERTPRSSTSQQ